MRALTTSLMLFGMMLTDDAIGNDVLERGLRSCAAEENTVKRVTCFDVLVAPLVNAANATATAAATPVNKGAWRIDVETSPIDDSKNVFISVKARASYQDDYATRMPYLWIRCMENTTSLIIDFDDDYMSDIAGRGNVTLRIDQAAAVEKHMDASTDNGSLGLWNGGNSIPLIKSMLDGSALLVRAVPVSASPVTIEFPISGLTDAVKPVREACGW